MAYTTINKSSDFFNTVLYTGDGTSNRTITNTFGTDFLWLKQRNGTDNHQLWDKVRGDGKRLQANQTNAESNLGTYIALISNGFKVDGGTYNNNGSTYAAWNWKAGGTGSANTDGYINSSVSVSTTSGFSIVKYTGNGSDDTSVGHGLGVAPKIVFFKNLSSSSEWRVQYRFVDGTRDRLQLNTNAAKYDSSNVTANSNTLFYLDTGGEQNSNGDNYIAYCFAEKTGYSKIGSYVGNGNANGTFIYTGFKPAFYLWKRSSGTADWHIVDNKRDTFNETDVNLYPNSNAAESIGNGYNGVDFLSNGIKIRQSNTDVNGSGSTYIYMAFAAAPLVGSNNIPANAR